LTENTSVSYRARGMGKKKRNSLLGRAVKVSGQLATTSIYRAARLAAAALDAAALLA